MDIKNQLILRNCKFRDDIVTLVNSYNDIPAFVRKITIQEVYQQLTLVEEQEASNAQQEEINKESQKAEKIKETAQN